jgi:hypothetical protein
MDRIKEFDVLNAAQWKRILEIYLIDRQQAANVLNVSIPRVSQLSSTGVLKSVVRGHFLKSDVERYAVKQNNRKTKIRKTEGVLTTECIFKLLVELYEQTEGQPISPKNIVEKAKKEIPESVNLVIPNRVANAIRILMNKGWVERLDYGLYVPVKIHNEKNKPI